jgi:polyisoprenoid-binding protein YceI
MKTPAAALLCALTVAAATPPAAAQPVTYVLDPQRSFVQAEVLHFGTSTMRARFGGDAHPLRGEVTLDRAAGTGVVSVRIATTGVDTGLRVFDARLREDDLLASEAHPEAFFIARRLRFDGDDLAEVRGEFTFRGMSDALSLQATRFDCRMVPAAPDAPGAIAVTAVTEVCGGDFEGVFQRSRFGSTFGLPFIGDRVLLRVQVEGRRR